MGASPVTGLPVPDYISVDRILGEHPVTASAPCRIDAGGTWDIKAMALPFEMHNPSTFNIALNMRTTVNLLPFRTGMIKISSQGFTKGIIINGRKPDLTGQFSIFIAAIGHFGFSGLEVKINSRSPVKSALGGSSTALVALIKALVKLDKLTRDNGRIITGKDILNLGYHLEDGISGGNCGIQDQAAAVYGGVNGWLWRYSDRKTPAVREKLLDNNGMKRLSERILVAFSGKLHVSAMTNRIWLKNFLEGKTRSGWLEANAVTGDLISAVRAMEWKEAVKLLKAEMKIRRKITPDALIPETSGLIKAAEGAGCAARFAGAGAGGSLWALGEPDDIEGLRIKWDNMLSKIKGACILPCAVDPKGVI